MERASGGGMGRVAGALIALALAVGLAATARALVAMPGESAAVGLAELSGLALIAGAGRVLLSLLPAGRLGSHRPRELATTWATSHLLGVLALAATSVVASGFGLDERIERGGWSEWALYLGPWTVLLALRLASLPGKMAPRHRRPGTPLVGWTRALPVAFAVLALVHLFGARLGEGRTPFATEGYLGRPLALLFGERDAVPLVLLSASWIAAALLVVHGLELARRQAPARWAIGLLVLATPSALLMTAGQQPELVTAMQFGAGAAFGVGWLRLADRRSRALSALAFLSLIFTSWSGFALAGVGLATFAAFTPAPSRRGTLLAAALLWLFVAWPVAGTVTHQLGNLEPHWLAPDPSTRIAVAFDLLRFGLWGPLLALGLVAGARLRRRDPRDPPRADPPVREWAACATVVLGGLLVSGRGFTFGPTATDTPPFALWAQLGFLIVLPAAALVVGLALSRGDVR